MKKLALLGATLLAFGGTAQAAVFGSAVVQSAHLTTHHRSYWWIGVENCTLSTSTFRDGAWRAQPSVICTGEAAGWHSTPQQLNPADNAAAPYGPCGYEGRLCVNSRRSETSLAR